MSAVENIDQGHANSGGEGGSDHSRSKDTAGEGLNLFLMRHGETEWALTGQHTGRTDLPLTVRGQAQACELGQQLQGIEFARVLTSPLKRALQTCEQAAPNRAFTRDPDLAEWDYGDYEGKTSAAIRKDRSGWDVFKDGCPNGESPEQVSARADRLIARLRRETGHIALFSHGQFGVVLAARWIGLPVADAGHFSLDVASVSVLAFSPHHPELAVIALWNRVSPERFRSSFVASPAS